MKIGILAIQGDFEAHRKMLDALGAETREVRTPGDLEELDAMVLPGGESTTHIKILEEEGLGAALRQFAACRGAIFGTCAGAILMAREVRNPQQRSLDLMDITVVRNGYGRQVVSEVRHGTCRLSDAPLEMVFIRAPVIERTGPGVDVLAEEGGHPVLVRQGRLLAATFHPELTSDSTVHRYFLDLAGKKARAA